MAMPLPQPSMLKKRFILMSLCVGLLGTTTEGKYIRNIINSATSYIKRVKREWGNKNHTCAEPYLHTKMSNLTFTESWNFLDQVYVEFRINLMGAPSIFGFLAVYNRTRFFGTFAYYSIAVWVCCQCDYINYIAKIFNRLSSSES